MNPRPNANPASQTLTGFFEGRGGTGGKLLAQNDGEIIILVGENDRLKAGHKEQRDNTNNHDKNKCGHLSLLL